MMHVRAPILIVGSPRSGTTMLGQLLASHPGIAYWEEPRPIWSTGHAWRGDDALSAEDLTPGIARRIDGRFGQFLAASGRERFCEKTPSNCLRLRFIHALYPDAKVIHLVRDGRAVVASMLRMLEKPPDAGRMRARWKETMWRDLPALVPAFLRDTIGRRWRGGQKAYWGPRPPGWRGWLDLPAPVRLARQWRVLVGTARRDLSVFPAENRLEVRYEDFVAAPEAALGRIFSLAGLDFPEKLSTAAVSRDSMGEWRATLDKGAIAQIEAEAGGLLRELGYLAGA